MEVASNREARRELEFFIDRIERWITENDNGLHTHLGRIDAIFLAGYHDSLPPELLQRVLDRSDDPECKASLLEAHLQ